MPLHIQVKRNGRVLKGGPSGKGYGSVDLNAFYTVAVGEAWPDLQWNKDYTVGEMLDKGLIGEFEMMGLPYQIPADKVPVQRGPQTVKADHVFDHSEGAITFKKGDVLLASRH